MDRINTHIAYEHIKSKILTGIYPPGSRLRTAMLAKETGVSRTPVRDALRLLETDGLVVIRPRLGATVKTLELEEFAQLCELRMVLETYAAALAARKRTGEELKTLKASYERLEKTTRRMKKQPENADLIHAFQQEDIAFHRIILTAAGNSALEKECTRIHLLDNLLSGQFSHSWLQWPVAERQRRQAESLRIHHDLLRAVEKQDASRARLSMQKQLQGVLDQCRAAIARKEKLKKARFRKAGK